MSEGGERGFEVMKVGGREEMKKDGWTEIGRERATIDKQRQSLQRRLNN